MIATQESANDIIACEVMFKAIAGQDSAKYNAKQSTVIQIANCEPLKLQCRKIVASAILEIHASAS